MPSRPPQCIPRHVLATSSHSPLGPSIALPPSAERIGPKTSAHCDLPSRCFECFQCRPYPSTADKTCPLHLQSITMTCAVSAAPSVISTPPIPPPGQRCCTIACFPHCSEPSSVHGLALTFGCNLSRAKSPWKVACNISYKRYYEGKKRVQFQMWICFQFSVALDIKFCCHLCKQFSNTGGHNCCRRMQAQKPR